MKVCLVDTYIQRGRGQQDVCGLGHVSGVQAVVVGHVRVIVALQGQHERHKGVRWNLERPHQVSLLRATHRWKERKNKTLEGVPSCEDVDTFAG